MARKRVLRRMPLGDLRDLHEAYAGLARRASVQIALHPRLGPLPLLEQVAVWYRDDSGLPKILDATERLFGRDGVRLAQWMMTELEYVPEGLIEGYLRDLKGTLGRDPDHAGRY